MRLIILNGPSGVGKTTVARLLSQKSESSVCIHGDVLREMIVSRDGSEDGRLGYRNGALLVNNFKDASYDLIVFDYIFPSNEHLEFFIGLLQDFSSAFIFTLWAAERVVQGRRRERDRDDRRFSVADSYDELQSNLQDFKTVIETDDLSPEQIADDIWDRVHMK